MKFFPPYGNFSTHIGLMECKGLIMHPVTRSPEQKNKEKDIELADKMAFTDL